MTHTPGTVSIARGVNVDTSDISIGQAVVNFIVAQATSSRRAAHLEKKIQSTQFDRDRGVGILVDDAGAREHLANALKFDRNVMKLARGSWGTGFGRTGTILDVKVTIWNVEV